MWLSGIVNAEGNLWKEQRRFLRQRLPQCRNGEEGRDLLESRIMVSIFQVDIYKPIQKI